MTAAPADRFIAAEIRSPFVAQGISAKSLAFAGARFAGLFSGGLYATNGSIVREAATNFSKSPVVSTEI
jgi:hypothetical protein